ncbi:MAG: site-specific DNA-methyltransferase [Candidatus Omnitrophica bacterium]|nr:site-specific DNA-methyltransferase [Candidatus Omnitrophota bacterium]
MDKMKMRTPNLTEENIERLASLFPNAITEIKDESGATKKAIDFDFLKQVLSKDIVEGDDERYRLDWPGKKASLLKANTPITKTLRPCREESVNFDTTENLYIEGDNFEVLKILQESYLGKVKMIYIDPPYNTGNDFIYKDDFATSEEDYEEELGATDEEGGKLFRNTDSNGRFHSDWLSMMYERLVVARDLLEDDGVVFISINDNEVHNLRKICDEVFGEENFVGNVVVGKGTTTGQDANLLGSSVDYMLMYTKMSEVFHLIGLPLNEQDKKRFSCEDEKGKYSVLQFRKTGTNDRRQDRPNLYYALTDPDGIEIYPIGPGGYESRWRTNRKTFSKWESENLIEWKKDSSGTYKPYVKYYLEGRTKQVSNLWTDIEGNKKASITIKSLFNGKVFDFPKPVELLIKCCIISNVTHNDIILDFFSGSATTAHAVMQLNAEDGVNRKFIMVQLPEKTDEDSEAYKAGYKTITDIGKERIRRAGKKIVEELKAKTQQLKIGEEPVDASKLDIGFRVYKTDDTNMKDVFYHPAKLDQKQLAFVESNIKKDRTPEDLLTQVILDLGLELSLPIETKKIGKNTVFIVQTNALVACFDNDIDFKIVDTIAGLKPFKVVFKDASFKDDKDRINVEERFKRLSPETKVTVI